MASKLEQRLYGHLLALGVPVEHREFRFDKVRRWRFDFAWPDRMLAVEVCGVRSSYSGKSKYTQPAGLAGFFTKLNAAQLQGWRVLCFTSSQVDDGTAAAAIESALCDDRDV